MNTREFMCECVHVTYTCVCMCIRFPEEVVVSGKHGVRIAGLKREKRSEQAAGMVKSKDSKGRREGEGGRGDGGRAGGGVEEGGRGGG